MFMDVVMEIVGTGIFIAAPGLLFVAIVMRVLRRSAAPVQWLIRSLLVAVVLTPTIVIHNPHGPRGFPALLALIGNGPKGSADVLPLGVFPIAVAWILIFVFLWFRARRTSQSAHRSA